jgi:hypothetical protein
MGVLLATGLFIRKCSCLPTSPKQICVSSLSQSTHHVTHSFHPFMYTDEGRRFMDRLWSETVEELEVQSLCKSIKGQVADCRFPPSQTFQ